MEEQIKLLTEEIKNTLLSYGCLNAKNTLWAKKDCAGYLKISEKSLDELISKNQFIEPSINISGSAQGRRWIAQQVIDWAINKQFSKGRPRSA